MTDLEEQPATTRLSVKVLNPLDQNRGNYDEISTPQSLQINQGRSNKKLYWIIGSAVVLVCIIAGISIGVARATTSNPQNNAQTINLSGNGNGPTLAVATSSSSSSSTTSTTTINLPTTQSNNNCAGTKYTVVSGDSCVTIAAKYGVTLSSVMALNPQCGPNLNIGNVLCIPTIGTTTTTSSTSSTVTKPVQTSTTSSVTKSTTAASIATTTTISMASSSSVSSCSGVTYTVKSGDYCSAIATSFGISLTTLQNANPSCGVGLQVGAVLCIPGGTSTSVGPTTTFTTIAGAGITYSMFVNAFTSNGWPTPSQTQYSNFVTQYQSAGGITSTMEAAMFLAQIMQESGGLQFVREIVCAPTCVGCANGYQSITVENESCNCQSAYRVAGNDPNLFYYGRGYIQLTWSYNYAAASQALFGDNRLVTNPDTVASNNAYSWSTAMWFWKTNVHSATGVQSGSFGAATNAVNGGIECANGCTTACQNRFGFYKNNLIALGLNVIPSNAGCGTPA